MRRYDLTANRYEAGGSVGYKLDERSYVVGALRYENDDFSPFDYQWIASVGYGYTALKNQRTELSFEIGPGYKRYRPSAYDLVVGDPPVTTRIRPDADGQVVARGLISFRHKITANTTFENVLLTEADQRSYMNQARSQRSKGFQKIEVQFDPSPVERAAAPDRD